MENPNMQTLPPLPKEQDGSSQPVLSFPLTSADSPKMSEVSRSLSSPDNSHASMGSCGLKKLDIPNQQGWDQLYTSLKALVTKVVSQLRKSILDELLDRDPISYQLPENNEEINVSINKTNPSSLVEVKTRAKSTLVGEETVSFLLPPDCLIGTELDKNVQHQSSFEERLQGWNIACRQRANGKLDMNYRHGQSRRMFRSIVEVVEFIMETLINQEPPWSSSLQEQGHATAKKGLSKRKISSSKKEKFPPSKSLRISSAEKVTVERYLKPNSENEDDASSDEETQ